MLSYKSALNILVSHPCSLNISHSVFEIGPQLDDICGKLLYAPIQPHARAYVPKATYRAAAKCSKLWFRKSKTLIDLAKPGLPDLSSIIMR